MNFSSMNLPCLPLDQYKLLASIILLARSTTHYMKFMSFYLFWIWLLLPSSDFPWLLDKILWKEYEQPSLICSLYDFINYYHNHQSSLFKIFNYLIISNSETHPKLCLSFRNFRGALFSSVMAFWRLGPGGVRRGPIKTRHKSFS